MMHQGITDLNTLLTNIAPELSPTAYVFCTVPVAESPDFLELDPLGMFQEAEGVTFILRLETAVQQGLSFPSVQRQITLTVHSSLDAVGLTAAVASALARHDISANVVAAYFHDHIFVPQEKAEQAVAVLKSLAESGA